MLIKFFGAPPPADSNSPQSVADWIKARIPCNDQGLQFVPFPERNRIIYHLVSDFGVSHAVVGKAMNIVFGGPVVPTPMTTPQGLQIKAALPKKVTDRAPWNGWKLATRWRWQPTISTK